MENKKTAVEFAIQKLEKFIVKGNQIAVEAILEQAKEMEKQQIIKAIIDQYTNGDLSAEQYYNEYYGK